MKTPPLLASSQPEFTDELIREITNHLSRSVEPWWREYQAQRGENGALMLHAPRDDGDSSKALPVTYTLAPGQSPLVHVIFSEKMEDDANEGLHDLYSEASNLLNFLGENVSGLEWLMYGQRPDSDCIGVIGGYPVGVDSGLSGTWKLHRDSS